MQTFHFEKNNNVEIWPLKAHSHRPSVTGLKFGSSNKCCTCMGSLVNKYHYNGTFVWLFNSSLLLKIQMEIYKHYNYLRSIFNQILFTKYIKNASQ
jgi:hypothetical protein